MGSIHSGTLAGECQGTKLHQRVYGGLEGFLSGNGSHPISLLVFMTEIADNLCQLFHPQKWRSPKRGSWTMTVGVTVCPLAVHLDDQDDLEWLCIGIL